jgi:uncharacterized Zn-finger protein
MSGRQAARIAGAARHFLTGKPMNNLSKVELLASDLNPQGGIYCPSPKADMKIWNTHPKVYLDIVHDGEAKCPYCSTVYTLKAGEHFSGTH